MIIEYRRRQYNVPEWAKFIATDSDGRVYVYSDAPRFSCAFCLPGNGRVSYVGTREPVKSPGNSLERITASVIPHYRLTPVGEIKPGDVITTRSKSKRSWCPPITVEEIGYLFLNGRDCNGTEYEIRKSASIFKQVKP